MNDNKNEPEWMDDILTMLNSSQKEEFLRVYQRLYRFQQNNDELIAILTALNYNCLLISKTCQLFSQSSRFLSNVTTAIVEEKKRLADAAKSTAASADTARAAAQEASQAASNAANSRLPWGRLFGWNLISSLIISVVIGGCILTGFAFLASKLPADTLTAQAYEAQLNQARNVIALQNQKIAALKNELDNTPPAFQQGNHGFEGLRHSGE